MGAYRSKPITDKVSNDELGKYVKCGASSMQGWRVTQEDAHNCIIEYDENASLFAVYDGHGGHEVAQYCSENLPQYLKDCASYKSGDYVKALKEAFLGFDATLVEPKIVKILKQIVKSADEDLDGSENQNSGSEDEENIRNLFEEAQMPLEEVMAKYQSDGLNPALKKLKGVTPPSPYLTAKKSNKLKSSEEACSSKAGSSSSCGVEPSEESSCESAEKDEKSSNGETDSKDSASNGNTEKKKVIEKSDESNGEQKSESMAESNSDDASQETKDSKKKAPEKSKSTSTEKGGDQDEDKMEMKSENVKEEASNEMIKENDKSKGENVQSSSKAVKEEIMGDQKEIKDQVKKDSPIKKLEVNGDIEPKEMLKGAKKEPHENGDVADEETEEDEEKDEDEEKKSPKGKGKAIVKKFDVPKRTSARQRNMAILFHSLLLAQDSADSESDDEGDESFEGAEESSSNEEEEKEEGEAEGEDEEEGDDDEEGDEEGEEEEDDDYEAEEGAEEDMPTLAKGPGVESGCTAVVALLHGRDLYVANAGDSRCIVSRSGEALDMSLDHKPEDDIEMERIITAGGFVSCDGRVNGGLNLSRAIGDHAYKQTEHFPPEEQMITALPDVRTISVDPDTDEFMVLACDGIWNSMTSQEVVNFVRERLRSSDKKLSAICEELFDFCLAPNTASDGTGCDNMTAVIIQFLPIMSEASSSDLPNTSINTAPGKRPASPTENSDSSAKRFKTGVV